MPYATAHHHAQILQACSKLDCDGDSVTVALPDLARSVTVRLSYDDVSPGEYPDVYGRVSVIGSHAYRPERPAGFDGSARKVWLDRSTQVWWQPAYAGQQWSDVQETWERGFCIVAVEVTEQCSCCDRAIVIGSASIGAVEWDGVADVLHELVEDALEESEADVHAPRPSVREALDNAQAALRALHAAIGSADIEPFDCGEPWRAQTGALELTEDVDTALSKVETFLYPRPGKTRVVNG